MSSKLKSLSLPTLLAGAFLSNITACSGNKGDMPSEPEIPLSEVKFTITAAASGENGDDTPAEIKSITTVFYKGDAYVGKTDAEISPDNQQCTSTVPATLSQRPDRMVVFVNIPTAEIPQVPLSQLHLSSVKSLITDEGAHYMVSIPDKNESELIYTNLDNNAYSGNTTLSAKVERLAAKVTVSFSEASLPAISLKKMDSTESRELSLTIDNWGVTAVDKATSLVRHYTDFPDNTSTWWSSPVNWTESLNWNHTDYPVSTSSVKDDSPVKHTPFSSITSKSGEELLVCETTRPASTFEIPNSRPSVIVTGTYKVNGTAVTFYRYGDNGIFLEDEYWETMATLQDVIYKSNGEKPTAQELRSIAETTHLSGTQGDALVTIQIPSTASLSGYVDKDGQAFDGIETLNAALAQACPEMEKFLNGHCYFIIPIRHKGYDNSSETQGLGAYGLVRNHHYSINISSISGLGQGVVSENAILLEGKSQGKVKTYQVRHTVSVVPWDKLPTQDVEI